MIQPILTWAALMAKLAAVIRADTAIAGWITATYGADAKLTLQSGKDLTDPDAAAAAPMLLLTPLPRPQSSAATVPGSISTQVAVAFILEAATTATATDGGSGTADTLEVVHAGIARAEAFAALLVAAMDRATTAAKLTFGELDLDEISSWPYVAGGFSVTAIPLRCNASTGIVTL